MRETRTEATHFDMPPEPQALACAVLRNADNIASPSWLSSLKACISLTYANSRFSLPLHNTRFFVLGTLSKAGKPRRLKPAAQGRRTAHYLSNSAWMVIAVASMSFLSHSSIVVAQQNDRLRSVAEDYWNATLSQKPVYATSIGDYRFNDQLADYSEAGRKQWENKLNRLLKNERRVVRQNLSPEDKITYDLLERQMRDDLLRLNSLAYLLPLDPLDGLHLQLPLIQVTQPFRNADDFRSYEARLRAFPKQVTDVITNMRDGVNRGWIAPRVIVEKVIPQIREQIVADPKKSELYTPIRNAKNLSDTDRKQLSLQIENAIRRDVVPAYLQLLAYVEDDYLPVARDTVGLSALRNGDKVYALLARLHTTVTLSPEEIHNLGLAEVKRIRQAMSKIKNEIGFKGTLDEFLRKVGSDPAQHFKTSDELLSAAKAHLQFAKSQMGKLFTRLPKADCVVKPIESFRAPASPVGYYNPAPADFSRPGYFYINLYAPQQRLRFTLEALTYHEAIPGHHLQISLHQETTGLPEFRKYGSFTAFVEGWALYAEKLGYEIGGYRDPYARLGQLNFEMWRACRLVVDTGMHMKGWSRQRAIDFMEKNTSLARLDIETEVDRYITWPGQALAYKIGELRILKIRHQAEKTLGQRFDLRTFHDALLAEGAMPLDMLEKHMIEWIDKQ